MLWLAWGPSLIRTMRLVPASMAILLATFPVSPLVADPVPGTTTEPLPYVTGPLPSQTGLESRSSALGQAFGTIVGRVTSIDAGIDTLFDSNVLREGGSFVRSTGSRSDIIFTPNATLQAGLPVGRQQLFASVNIGRDFYTHNTSYDRSRINAGGGVNFNAGPSCSGSIFGQYSERQGTQLDLVAVVPNVQKDTTYGANANCGRSRGLGFGGGYTRSETRNGSSIYNLLDSNTSSYTANVHYNSGLLGSLVLTGGYSDIGYPGPGSQALRGSDGIRQYSGQLSYRREIGPVLTGSIGASYFKIVPKNPTRDVNGVSSNLGYAGPGFDVSLNYHPGVRLSASLNASRNVTASSNVGAAYVLNSDYSVDINYKLSPRLSTGFGGSYDKRNYRGSFASVVDPFARTSDTLYRTYVQASYSPARRYSFNINVAQQGLRSKPSLFDYDSTTASLGLHVKFR